VRHGNDTRIGPDGQDYDPEALRRVSARQRPPRDSKWTSWWGLHNSITSGANVTSFGYNGQGDTTSCSATSGTPCSGAGSATYTFDEENRLIKETDSLKGPETMLYDGNGLLQQEKETIPGPCPAIVKGAVKRHVPAPTTASPSLSCLYTDQLTWSTALGDPTLASTHTWSSSLDLGTTDYVMGPDGSPVEQLTTSGTSATPEWYYADFQGNTRVLMDASGSPQVTYNYPAWGATTNWVGTGNGTPLQYNATFTDQWTGLVYDQARWYDPSTGQFVSQDPMVDQTLQPYAYASGNPVDNRDPTGLRPFRGGSSVPGCYVHPELRKQRLGGTFIFYARSVQYCDLPNVTMVVLLTLWYCDSALWGCIWDLRAGLGTCGWMNTLPEIQYPCPANNEFDDGRKAWRWGHEWYISDERYSGGNGWHSTACLAALADNGARARGCRNSRDRHIKKP